MPDSPSTQKMLERFEKSEEWRESKPQDSDDVIRKMRYWLGYSPSQKQKIAVLRFAEERDIPISYRAKKIEYQKPKRKGVQIQTHVTHHKRKGKLTTVYRDSKGRFKSKKRK